ncbi:MAG: hypothetical protein WDM89_04405 [Rhizomicrobium sp.]
MPGPQHLHRDGTRRVFGGLSFVNLRDGGGSDRFAELREHGIDRLAKFVFDDGFRLRHRERRKAVLQMLQRMRDVVTDEIGPRCEHLAELDMRRPEAFQSARQSLARRQILVLRRTDAKQEAREFQRRWHSIEIFARHQRIMPRQRTRDVKKAGGIGEKHSSPFNPKFVMAALKAAIQNLFAR